MGSVPTHQDVCMSPLYRVEWSKVHMATNIYSPRFESGIPQPAGASHFLVGRPAGLAKHIQVGL